MNTVINNLRPSTRSTVRALFQHTADAAHYEGFRMKTLETFFFLFQWQNFFAETSWNWKMEVYSEDLELVKFSQHIFQVFCGFCLLLVALAKCKLTPSHCVRGGKTVPCLWSRTVQAVPSKDSNQERYQFIFISITTKCFKMYMHVIFFRTTRWRGRNLPPR